MTAIEIEALIKLIQDLAPPAIELVKQFVNKLTGATEDQIAALGHALNAQAINDINSELSK